MRRSQPYCAPVLCQTIQNAPSTFAQCSTLDPALRMEDDGINPAVWFISAVVLAFLTATPGPLQATWDMYIVAPFRNLRTQQLRKKDVEVGRKLAQGGFGTVYMGKSGATIPGKIRKGQVLISSQCLEYLYVYGSVRCLGSNVCCNALVCFCESPLV